MSEIKYDFDFIAIGSGFGGSVSAHRLTEKGYKVGVLEMGKRYRTSDFPKSSWNVRKFLWLPFFKLFGFFRMTLFQHVFVLSGVGVGGGSLVYANTLLVPPDKVWNDPKWKDLQNWQKIMPTYYALAKKMLGVVTNSYMGDADKVLQKTAELQGVGNTFYPTDVGVYFGQKGVTVPDPFFGGEGPERTGCELCGGCMVGCRYNAKNTLDKNYLYLAEKYGAQVIPESMVIDVKPIGGIVDGDKGYEITTKKSTSWFGKKTVYTTRGVVFSAGVLGTVRILSEAKENGSLPNLSKCLGEVVRTNSESIIAVRVRDKNLNMSDGVAIGSGVHIDEHTHIEATRYPNGSDAISMITTLLTNGKAGFTRPFTWLWVVITHPWKFLTMLIPFGFAKQSIILLCMQTLDGFIQLKRKRSIFSPFRKRLETENNTGVPIATYIPEANHFAEKMGEKFNGTPVTALSEIFLNVPTTAHIMGGAIMGASAEDGVIDSQNRVFNYKNMYVCDGSMIGANLGVNPSLSITAFSEHAMSHIKPKNKTDWNDRAV